MAPSGAKNILDRLLILNRRTSKSALAVPWLAFCLSVFSILCSGIAVLGQEPAVRDAETDLPARAMAILREKCLSCHGGSDKIRGGLALTSREAMLNGGDSGPAIDLESPEDSLLLSAVNYDALEMPPSGKLPAAEIGIIEEWLKAGAAWSGESIAAEPAPAHAPPTVNEETKKWWAWQPVKQPDVPAFADSESHPIDAFLRSSREQQGLAANGPADRRTLVRRAFYDLTGLPPTPQQVEAFVNDQRPDAWERLIDELLASPHYGEKWGRHWLDLVRYAESNSYERDGTKPFVWRYRDYVIRAFNDDKPYDQFLIEQLAGDELDDVTPESIIATGYYRLGIWDDEPADPEQAWYDDMDDVLATTSQSMLGLTINCARCHEHKIDPVPQADYYRLLAFFRNVRRYGVRAHETVVDASLRSIASPEAQEKFEGERREWQEKVEANRKALEAIEEIVKKDFIPVEHEDFRDEGKRIDLVRKRAGKVITQEQADEYARLMSDMRTLRENRPESLEMALCVKETGARPKKTHVLIRGNAHAEGDEVQPGFPEVLGVPDPEITPARGRSSGRRLALAKWIASRENPLTARVMANRIWQYHFGRGIVRTSSDYGFQGTPPTHPELLDWLAAEFIEGDWRIKRMHKLIMTSKAWQMSSEDNAACNAKDPLNDYFWKYELRRLTAEEVRDSILFVNGQLNSEKMYGPSIYPVQPQEVLDGQSIPGDNWHTSSGDELNRRSVYIHIKRSLPVPILANFDIADPDSPCPARFNTVQPTQALGMINSDFLKLQAGAFAQSVRDSVPEKENIAGQVGEALRRVLQREPEDAEVARGVAFVQSPPQTGEKETDRLALFCLIALNLNEFLYLD